MKYILNPYVSLRSWKLVPYAFYVSVIRDARGLKKDEFDILLRCDGLTDIPDSPALKLLFDKGLCRPAENGETLSENQKYRHCDNRYFPAMNFMITGKCNYNCRHCFNAADNAPLQSQWTLEEAEKLLDEARDCGIHAFTITGGEPMLHPDFMKILRGIHERGMFVEELNTNGFFLTEKILDEMDSFGCRPLMKISFDGVGYHDWMRNRKGAEEDALRAIKLCADKGFDVKLQTNVNRVNLSSMRETVLLAERLGASKIRIIRTTESPRWEKNAGNATLGVEEYYDEGIKLVSSLAGEISKIDVDIWQFLSFYPHDSAYSLNPVECGEGEYRDSLPVCRGNRGMVAVEANGNLCPCLQMSGYYEAHGDNVGNVKTTPLRELLSESRYLSEVTTTLGTLKQSDSDCGSCEFFRYCAGGCRALALALTGNKLGRDPLKCVFFKKNYPRKIAEALRGYRCLSTMNTVTSKETII